jgi:hypothetical protein
MSAARGSKEGLRLFDLVILVAIGVVGVIIAFWALSFIAGLLFGLVKLAIVIVVIAAVLWLLIGRRR